MVLSPALETGRNVDRLAVDEGDDCLLHVVPNACAIAEPLGLTLAHERVDRLDLDREQRLDGGLDLGLGGVDRDVEHDLAVLGRDGRLLGDNRTTDHVVVGVLAYAATSVLKRASMASSAALV